MIYLLDTDTVIYWLNGNKKISEKIISTGFHEIASSDISKSELYYGAYKSLKIEKNLLLIKFLSERITFLPFNNLAQSSFGKMKADLTKNGLRLDDMDLMIAATALAYDLIMVTNNKRHFERIPNLKIENWI